MEKSEAKEEIRKLSDLLRLYQHQYYVEVNPSVSDLEYDRLFDRLVELENEYPDLKEPDSPTARVGSDLASDLPEANHTVPVLSLDKAYSAQDVVNWMEKTKRNYGDDLSFAVEEKIDGISIVLYYEKGQLSRAVTRGNGFIGNDVTANVRTIGSVPLKLPEPINAAARGEIYLPVEKFEELNRKMDPPYANPRNLAAGTIRRKKSSEAARVPLDIYVYEGYFDEQPLRHEDIIKKLVNLGFRVNPRHEFFTSPEALGRYIERSSAERGELPYEIDGLVIKVNQIQARDVLGYTGHHPRWAIAYKFESSQGISKLKSIEVQVGRTGRITPVGKIEPVRIGGSTLTSITLHNQDYINILEAAPGDTVAVSRRGDVIPALEKVVEKGDDSAPSWQMPPECPSCGTTLENRGAHTFCPNRECPDQIRGRIFFFIDKKQMDIANFGPETVDFLIQKKLVTDVQDLYTLNYDVLADEKGFGEKKIGLIKEGIEKSRKRPYKTVLASLGIPELGKKAAELLISAGFTSIDMLIEASDENDPDRLIDVHGIGERTAEIIIEELKRPEIRKKIEDLRAAGLRFEAEESETGSSTGIFSGQSWCITGSFDNFKPRETALQEIENRGGDTVSQVTGKTTHLLCGQGGGSKKTKAEKLGVKIVDEAEFLKMINQD